MVGIMPPYLSPVSATPLRLDCHEPVAGLGISFGETESPFTHSSFVEPSPVASSLPVAGWYPMGPSESSNEPIFDLGSSMPGMDYGAYPNYADISTSPLGLYSTQPMIASSSYGRTQGATSGHPSGVWPITPSSEAISAFSSSEVKELDEYGEQLLIGDAMYAAEVPLLPQGPQVSTEDFSPLSLRGPGSLLGLNPNEEQNPSRIPGTTDQSLPSPPISKTDPVDTPSPRRRLSSESSRKCDLCDITFTRTSNCREHMKKKHDPTCKKTHSCGVCSRAFRRRPDLTRHVDCVSMGVFCGLELANACRSIAN